MEALDREARNLADFVIGKMRRGEYCDVSPLAPIIRGISNPQQRRKHVCGAGRGFVLVDAVGDIWPCHRFGGQGKDRQWVMGSIFGGFRDDMQMAFLDFDCDKDMEADCAVCPARGVCAGQCPAEAQEHAGSIYRTTASSCAIIRVFYRESLRLIDFLGKEKNDLFRSIYCQPPEARGSLPRVPPQRPPRTAAVPAPKGIPRIDTSGNPFRGLCSRSSAVLNHG
jgi:uncharacterized protein